VIVVDASAIVAIIRRETEQARISAGLLASAERRISPVSCLEVVMALAREYEAPEAEADLFLKKADIRLHPIDAEQAEWARRAFLTYGKGRHPARLNLGDCFSYAAAKALDAPLLYVGGDFAKTDLRTA
jgi:ribonuclease VapC